MRSTSCAVLSIAMVVFVNTSSAYALRASRYKIMPGPTHSVHEMSIGSHEAKKGEFPFQVSLRNSDGVHQCGGSIISHHTVVTAGHCVDDYPELQVVAGEHSLSRQEGTEQWRQVTRHIRHPEYHLDYAIGVPRNDIAVLLVNRPFVFNEFVQPIKLSRPGTIISGTAKMSGWGYITDWDFAATPDILHTEELPILNHTICLNTMLDESEFREYMLPDSIICTGPLSGGKGSCPGDSGGPLEQAGVLVGVVSWGANPCGSAGIPSGFTRVSAYTDWLIQTDREIRRRRVDAWPHGYHASRRNERL